MSELSHYHNTGNTADRNSEIIQKENPSEMTSSNSKFKLQNNEKSMSKKSLPSTPAIIGLNDQVVTGKNLSKNGS